MAMSATAGISKAASFSFGGSQETAIAKMKMDKRGSWPIVIDSKGNIVWIPGVKKSKFDKSKNDSYDILLKYY